MGEGGNMIDRGRCVTVVEGDDGSAVLIRPCVLLDHPLTLKGVRIDDRHEDAAGSYGSLEHLFALGLGLGSG